MESGQVQNVDEWEETLEEAAARNAALRSPRFEWRNREVWLHNANRDWTQYDIFVKIAELKAGGRGSRRGNL